MKGSNQDTFKIITVCGDTIEEIIVTRKELIEVASRLNDMNPELSPMYTIEAKFLGAK